MPAKTCGIKSLQPCKELAAQQNLCFFAVTFQTINYLLKHM
jgi:hypothetical protein